jgi:hypothetical protein
MNYLIHNQLFAAPRPVRNLKNAFATTLHMWSIKEFDMDTTLFTYLWQPFKQIGAKLNFLNKHYLKGLSNEEIFSLILPNFNNQPNELEAKKIILGEF